MNPNGSQILTEYGRVAGIEMSTWGFEKEALGGYISDYGLLQVDLRYLKTEYQQFLMQLESQVAIDTKHFTITGTGGQYGSKTDSRSHYVMAKYDGFYIRGGKFLPTWNLNITDHSSLIRKTLGLTPGSESYAGEIGYDHELGSILIGGNRDYFMGRITGRLKRAEGGLSGKYGNANKDYTVGGFINWGPIPYLHLYSELNNVIKEVEDQFGFYYSNTVTEYTTLGVYPVRGLGVSLTHQYQTDFEKLKQEIFTGGLTWSPRPHMEYQIDYGILKVAGQSFPHTIFLVHLWL